MASTRELFMSYKTIVVHCDASPKLSPRLQVAVELAQRFSAYLVGVHVQVPHTGVRSPPGKSIMLCWNASRESSRAAAEALPFLVSAEKVVVLIIDTKTFASGHGPEPGADVAAWLARHGATVTVQREVATD